MYKEIERQVAIRTGADERASNRDPPLSQNRNPDYNPPTEQMELSQWELSQDTNQNPALQALVNLRNQINGQRQTNGEVLANLIGNASDMDE